MVQGRPTTTMSGDAVVQALGGALALVAVALALIGVGAMALEVNGLGVSPIAVSTVLFLGLVVLVARVAGRFIPRPA